MSHAGGKQKLFFVTGSSPFRLHTWNAAVYLLSFHLLMVKCFNFFQPIQLPPSAINNDHQQIEKIQLFWFLFLLYPKESSCFCFLAIMAVDNQYKDWTLNQPPSFSLLPSISRPITLRLEIRSSHIRPNSQGQENMAAILKFSQQLLCQEGESCNCSLEAKNWHHWYVYANPSITSVRDTL